MKMALTGDYLAVTASSIDAIFADTIVPSTSSEHYNGPSIGILQTRITAHRVSISSKSVLRRRWADTDMTTPRPLHAIGYHDLRTVASTIASWLAFWARPRTMYCIGQMPFLPFHGLGHCQWTVSEPPRVQHETCAGVCWHSYPSQNSCKARCKIYKK